MRRNCNLELRLFPPSFSADSHDMVGESSESPQNQQQQQPLTIFYNGRVCVCDVTELQARAILMLANRENMDERIIKTPSSVGSEPASPTLSSHQLYSPTTAGSSMKKSLQRFLQKRRNRIQATSPYN